jgi:adenylate kinase family enzyme
MQVTAPRKLLIFGNSGAGKSTLANTLCQQLQLAHLDLDTLAWLPGSPPERSPLDQSQNAINHFMQQNPNWVIEGCYCDLLAMAQHQATVAVFLDLPTEQCIAHAHRRPWEPHKYASKAEQDANLPMLIDWIAAYSNRSDTFSRQAHQQLLERFSGQRYRVTSDADIDLLLASLSQ